MAAIRAAAAELEQVSLEDGLAICLAFLELEPQTFPRAAGRWVGRVAVERSVTLAESQLALAALAALQGPGALAGAQALVELAARYELGRVDRLLEPWLARRPTVS